MKKSTLITIIVAILLVILILGFFIFSLSKEKKPMTASEFVTAMQDKGYIVTDVKDQYLDYNYIESAYIASSSDYSYQIEFYVLSDNTYATNFYNNNKSIFESSKNNTSTETNTEGKNYSKYTLSSNDSFKYVSKVDNTVTYANVKSEYKDKVKSTLESIGY